MCPNCPQEPVERATHGLGDRVHWPHTLRLAVDIMDGCPAPMLLCWGDARATHANQAYATLAGSAAPAPPAGPACAAAFGQAARGEDVVLRGQALYWPGLHEQLFDVHLTPLRDERGAVGGVLCTLARSARPAAGEAGLRILVVEDNLDAQYLVCEMLKAFGHEADGVAHAEAALAMLAAKPHDLLFTDVSLPGMSGVELARQAVRAQPGLQVVFASGYGDALLRHVEFPYSSLQKPFEIEQLQAVLAASAARIQH